jgi:ribosome hibernation promoting factor
MRLQVKGKNLEVSDSIRAYAERKIAKVGKQLGDPVQVEVELSAERNPSIRDNQVAEATVFTKGHSLRVRQASRDMRQAIDGLVDKLLREVKQYKERRRLEPRRKAEHNGV